MKLERAPPQVVSPLQSNAAQLSVQLEEKNAEIAGLKGDMQKLQQKVGQQNRAILGFEKRAEALTHVFTFSTHRQSSSYTFTDGVSGHCSGQELFQAEDGNTHWMGFELEEGPTCTMHFKCLVLYPEDDVWWNVGSASRCDFLKPPTEANGEGCGARFELTKDDKEHLIRRDGTIKYRMVVHLYLPE